MKQVLSDKYSIAWFKLAECVSRGEKERALGVYRLLSHSIGDRAFARQLEGDLFLSFKDKLRAIKKYQDASLLYLQAGRKLEAAAVNEHLVTLEPKNCEHYERLVKIYYQLNLLSKAYLRVEQIVDLLILHTDNKIALQQFLSRLEEVDSSCYKHAQQYIGLEENKN